VPVVEEEKGRRRRRRVWERGGGVGVDDE